jgi:hypothetical protein
MGIPRREFLRASTVFALSAGLTLGLADMATAQKRRPTDAEKKTGFAVPDDVKRSPVFHMSKETFSPYVNTTFVIDPGYTFPLQVTLLEVKDLRTPAQKSRNLPGKDCFSITFSAPEGTTLKQGTYQVRHDALGQFELFIVPVPNKEGKPFFEAIFNRSNP